MDECCEINSLLKSINNLQPSIGDCMDIIEEQLADVQYLPTGSFNNDDSDEYRKVFKAFLKSKRQLEHETNALTETRKRVNDTKTSNLDPSQTKEYESCDFSETYHKWVSRALEEEGEDEVQRAHSLRTALRFQKFDKTVEKVIKVSANNPPDFALPENIGINETIDEAITLTEARVSTIDPISQATIRDPIRNKVCKHAYDRNTIKQYIEQQSDRKIIPRCPITGCTNRRKLSMDQCDNYPELFNQI